MKLKFNSLKFGRYLKKKRMEARLTQVDLAKILGYHPQFVANWERGICSPPPKKLSKIIKTLGIPPNEALSMLMAESQAYWTKLVF